MARLTMVTPPNLASGYRLAGADVVTAETPAEAATELERLLGDAEVGVIGVHAPLLDGMEPAARRQFEDRAAPVVVAVPAGVVGGQESSHRARLASMLQRAIGYRISFEEEEPR